MWCFPLVFLLLSGIEFIAGKAMEQWREMNRNAEKSLNLQAQRKEWRLWYVRYYVTPVV